MGGARNTLTSFVEWHSGGGSWVEFKYTFWDQIQIQIFDFLLCYPRLFTQQVTAGFFEALSQSIPAFMSTVLTMAMHGTLHWLHLHP